MYADPKTSFYYRANVCIALVFNADPDSSDVKAYATEAQRLAYKIKICEMGGATSGTMFDVVEDLTIEAQEALAHAEGYQKRARIRKLARSNKDYARSDESYNVEDVDMDEDEYTEDEKQDDEDQNYEEPHDEDYETEFDGDIQIASDDEDDYNDFQGKEVGDEIRGMNGVYNPEDSEDDGNIQTAYPVYSVLTKAEPLMMCGKNGNRPTGLSPFDAGAKAKAAERRVIAKTCVEYFDEDPVLMRQLMDEFERQKGRFEVLQTLPIRSGKSIASTGVPCF
jgi:hypothetical protein